MPDKAAGALRPFHGRPGGRLCLVVLYMYTTLGAAAPRKRLRFVGDADACEVPATYRQRAPAASYTVQYHLLARKGKGAVLVVEGAFAEFSTCQAILQGLAGAGTPSSARITQQAPPCPLSIRCRHRELGEGWALPGLKPSPLR